MTRYHSSRRDTAIRLLWAAACLLLCVCGTLRPAVAEDLTIDGLLARLIGDRPDLNALTARCRVTVSDVPPAPGRPEGGNALKPPGEDIEETIFYRSPDRLRLNLSWPDREEVFLIAGNNALVMIGDQATDTPWPQPPLLFQLLLGNSANSLKPLLLEYGFDFQRIELTGKFVVLGSSDDNPFYAQAWFETETMRLVRLLLPARDNQPSYDIRLENYRRHENSLDWPDDIRVKTDKNQIMQLHLKNLTVNPPTAAEELNPEELRKTIAVAPDPESSPTEDPEILKIRKQMEWFRKKLE